MRKLLCTLLALFVGFGCLAAQESKSIIDDINSPVNGQGRVTVMQDETIDGMLGTYHEVDSVALAQGLLHTNYTIVKGYKILVFSGNNQSKSKTEAQQKMSQVRNAFPDQEVTMTYEAPFWRVHAGNFITRPEATEILKQMKRKFPSFGKEMYVVDNVNVKRPTY
ncbi:SPOR domain-containing protein [Dysgonomonas sp. 25]|uniref:SPOR domain-containing protein n=1 Tax=Dysgonomonas sp. 25 TaxID=2302933 RepID=UPI0013D35593|nr:SPOR domain-containing protein [Dysgonomonas sp. 25]NDV69056.1 SPOR domain-containing protein [Dysgonomonas sp. 25]